MFAASRVILNEVKDLDRSLAKDSARFFATLKMTRNVLDNYYVPPYFYPEA